MAAVEVYRVRGRSMEPLLRHGDVLVVRRVSKAASLARGDIVTVEGPDRAGGRFLKRLVGLPNEEVRLSEGALYVNGERLAEPYLGGLPPYLGVAESRWVLGDDDYFAMGDNRAHSTDSRDFGPLQRRLILGTAVMRVWPPGRWGRIRRAGES